MTANTYGTFVHLTLVARQHRDHSVECAAGYGDDVVRRLQSAIIKYLLLDMQVQISNLPNSEYWEGGVQAFDLGTRLSDSGLWIRVRTDLAAQAGMGLHKYTPPSTWAEHSQPGDSTRQHPRHIVHTTLPSSDVAQF